MIFDNSFDKLFTEYMYIYDIYNYFQRIVKVVFFAVLILQKALKSGTSRIFGIFKIRY